MCRAHLCFASPSLSLLPLLPTHRTSPSSCCFISRHACVQQVSRFAPSPHLAVSRKPRFHTAPAHAVDCNAEQDKTDNDANTNANTEDGGAFVRKFDPDSKTDAFGRDPRKETEFWMGAAKSVLDSDEVQQAIADHAADGRDGLTDEQRAYRDFIKGLDEKSSEQK